VIRELGRLDRLRRARLCLLVPAQEPGFTRAFFLAGGRVVTERTLPPGAGARVELDTGIAETERAGESLAAEDVDELLLVGEFLRRPPPELRVVPLDRLTRRAA
jgi:hypothetical protein